MYHTREYHSPSFFSGFRPALSACSLLLVLLLSACGLGGGSTGTVSTPTGGSTTATTQPTSIPTQPPTSVPVQPTSAPATNLTNYTGNGFTIGYPAGWTIEKVSPSAASVIFINPTRTIEFIVTVSPNPNANSATSVALDPLVPAMQSKPHYQKVDLASNTTIGGESWDQTGAIGDLPYNGQPVSTKVIAMALNRPAHDANTKMYKIQFSAPAKDFDQTENTAFQPMLQSFKFV
ncbi:hypothetical protein KDA_64700 [Dictyobacter alpinus]|uniref:PsbP C-terminal domain-containing protein n=1 Tax=Dictyobacter alpinus TaxID=2014873 RepID=A0A402BI32_9CHLR|nr:hypothetical protein [Dictyobacter alpinus]GCE30986.1 hypothetical protein KDA_64700 [Dictyobacter alpinus]